MGVSVVFEGGSEPVQLVPGKETELAVRVRNTGQVVDRVLFDLLGDTAAYAKVEPPRLNLLPGTTERVVIRFSPPRAATLAPGGVPFALRAASTEDREGSSIEEGFAVIGEFSDLSAQLVPRSATGRRSAKFRLVVENRGNRPETARVEPLDPDDKLTFRTRPVGFVANPGTATFVQLKTAPRETFFRGPDRALPFQAAVLPERGEAVTVEGAVQQKQLLPKWLFPALGVAALVAGGLVAIYFLALRPIVNSAATAQGNAARAQAQASKAAQQANAAKKAANAANTRSGTLSKLAVKVASPSVLAGTTEQATAGGTAANGNAAKPDVVWTSSDPAVATVSPQGVVSALTPGTATITATSVSHGSSAPAPGASASASPAAPSVTGTPAAAGSSPVVSGSATVNVVGPVSVTTKGLPQAVLGKRYSQSLGGEGGTGVYAWSIASGSLPPGFTLSPAGVVSGTASGVGTSTFTARVVNQGPPSQSATKQFTISIIDSPAVKTSNLAGAILGSAYSQRLVGTYGRAPYAWALVAGQGTLPNGLSLDQATGVISGTPAKTGVFSFRVQVTDSASQPQSGTQQLSIAVAAPLGISTPAVLPQEAVKGQPFSLELGSSGGNDSVSWSLASGELPPGLNLSASGTISGTPAATGKSTFTVKASSAGPPAQSKTKAVTLTVVDKTAVATSALDDATTGAAYTQTLHASFGTAPYMWQVVPGKGNLPPGLTLSKSGVISGTPTMAGTSTFTVRADDSTKPSQSATQALSIRVASPLSISTLGLPDAVVPADASTPEYSEALSASGGAAPYTWSVSSGSLPSGLSLDRDSGKITGFPRKAGTATFTVTATDDGHPARTDSRQLTLTAVPELVPTTTSLPRAAVGNPYTAQLTARGGTGTDVYTLTGTLPPGLTLSASGQITGTPTTAGAYQFSAVVTDESSPPQSKQENEVITVGGSLQIVTQSLPDAEAGHAYDQTLQATGGNPPYTWSVTSGTLPTGLRLNPLSGEISGTTQSVAAGATVTFSVTDAGPPKQTVSKALTIRVSSPLSFSEPLPTAAVVGQPFAVTPKPQGGSGSFQWSESGDLPDGLSFNSANGEISGTIASSAKPGSYSFSLTLSDSDGGLKPATNSFTLKVAAPLATNGSLNITAAFGKSFTQQITPTGGVPSYSYAFAAGDDVPSWLSVDSSSGVISGTPDVSCSNASDTPSSQSDTFSCPPATFTEPVTVTDASGETSTVTVNLTVNTPPLVVNHVTTATQTAGKALSLSLGTVRNGYGSGSTVSYTATGLPCSADGSVCDQLNFSTGKVTGTLPDFGAGSYNVVVTVTQADPTAGSSFNYIGSYTVTIKTASGVTGSGS